MIYLIYIIINYYDYIYYIIIIFLFIYIYLLVLFKNIYEIYITNHVNSLLVEFSLSDFLCFWIDFNSSLFLNPINNNSTPPPNTTIVITLKTRHDEVLSIF
jgi:hypothetical protein